MQESRTVSDELDVLRALWVHGDFGGQEMNWQHANGEITNGAYFPGTHNGAILFLHGSGDFYETALHRPLTWIQWLKREGRTPHLFVFNPRGTGKSRGETCSRSVAEDVLIIFKYLIQRGVDPNQVVVAGQELGGFLGACGAALVQKTFPEYTIHFLGDRPFFRMQDVIAKSAEHSICSTVTKKIDLLRAHIVMQLSGWDQDLLKTVRSLKGRVCILYHRDDERVPYASLFQASTSSAALTCFQLKERGSSAHQQEFTPRAWRVIGEELKRMLGLLDLA